MRWRFLHGVRQRVLTFTEEYNRHSALANLANHNREQRSVHTYPTEDMCVCFLTVLRAVLFQSLCSQSLRPYRGLALPCKAMCLYWWLCVSTQATDNRDALAKFTYSAIFDWIVLKINKTLAAPSSSLKKTIGILDIFGWVFNTKSSPYWTRLSFLHSHLRRSP